MLIDPNGVPVMTFQQATHAQELVGRVEGRDLHHWDTRLPLGIATPPAPPSTPSRGVRRPATPPGMEGGVRTGHSPPSKGACRPTALPGLGGGGVRTGAAPHWR